MLTFIYTNLRQRSRRSKSSFYLHDYCLGSQSGIILFLTHFDTICFIHQAFNELIEMDRLDLEDTDVKPYTVDGHVMLSELNHGLRKHYYWKPLYGPDIENMSVAL